jgi:hypothetical protein
VEFVHNCIDFASPARGGFLTAAFRADEKTDNESAGGRSYSLIESKLFPGADAEGKQAARFAKKTE